MRVKLLCLIIALTGIIGTTSAQVPGYVPANGLQAWWSLDNTGNDQSGSNNHYTNFGMTYTADRFSNPSSAANGIASQQQYMLCNTPSFTLGANSTFTVSIWLFKPSALYGVVMMHGSTAAGNFIWNFQTSNSGDLQFGTNKQQSSWIWTQTTHSINAWDHFVATYNNGAITLYKNGVLAATNTFTHTAVTTAVLPIYLCRGVSGANSSATIDDVGIWNRVLTMQEINDLHTGGCAVSYSTVQFTSCHSYTWPQNNQTYTQSGMYTDTMINHLGCDSVITLDLTIKPNTYATQFELECHSFTWINGVTYTSSVDTAQFIVPNAAGCDSIITLDLTIVNLHFTQQPTDAQANTGTNAVFDVATSPQIAIYRWQTDAGSGFEYLMDTGQYSGSLTSALTVSNITVNNHLQPFRCISSIGDCKDTSDIVVITVPDIGIDETPDNRLVAVFPNPISDKLFIQTDSRLAGSAFEITDLAGRSVLQGVIVSEMTTIGFEGVPSGVYILTFDDNLKKPLRLVKR